MTMTPPIVVNAGDPDSLTRLLTSGSATERLFGRAVAAELVSQKRFSEWINAEIARGTERTDILWVLSNFCVSILASTSGSMMKAGGDEAMIRGLKTVIDNTFVPTAEAVRALKGKAE